MEDRPFVIHGKTVSWKCHDWTPDKLSSVIKKNLSYRIGKKNSPDVQYETDCEYVKASISDFNEWLSDGCEINTIENTDTKHKENPFLSYNKDSYWAYADYNYMKHLFSNEETLLDVVDWSTVGLSGRNGKDSTFWLGSQGANTPCHYDTYGCNLVAQIFGRKRWTLFPPDQTAMMYPTRIPYEESSVFSQVNIANPNLHKYQKFKKCTPYIVVLEPGDVLYVPRHWWHYVECLDTAISINTWLEMDEDREERVKEALARNIVFGLMQDTDEDWLNPTQDFTGNSTDLLNTALMDLNKECELLGKSTEHGSLANSTMGNCTPCDTTGTNSTQHDSVEKNIDSSKQLLQMFLNFLKTSQTTVLECNIYSFEVYLRDIRKNKEYLSFCETTNPDLHENDKEDPIPCKKVKVEEYLVTHQCKGTPSLCLKEKVVKNEQVNSACEIPEVTRNIEQVEKIHFITSDIVNCIVDREVLSLIVQKLKEKIQK